jgi:hypothetical protein
LNGRFGVDAFVNRDDPIPVVVFDRKDDLSDEADGSDNATQPERKRDRLLKHTANIKENFQKRHGRSESGSGSSMQDRLLEKYVLKL